MKFLKEIPVLGCEVFQVERFFKSDGIPKSKEAATNGYVRFGYYGDQFDFRFANKVEVNVPEGIIKVYSLNGQLSDESIRKTVMDKFSNDCVCYWAHIYQLLAADPALDAAIANGDAVPAKPVKKGGKARLSPNRANIFFATDVKGVVWHNDIRLSDDGWEVVPFATDRHATLNASSGSLLYIFSQN